MSAGDEESTPPLIRITPTPTAAEVAAIVGVLFAQRATTTVTEPAAPRGRSAWAASARTFSPAIGPATDWRRSAAAGWESA